MLTGLRVCIYDMPLSESEVVMLLTISLMGGFMTNRICFIKLVDLICVWSHMFKVVLSSWWIVSFIRMKELSLTLLDSFKSSFIGQMTV